ncbi:hypothetical protein MKW94_027308, partial [Papaver nudicaule]|nr:hypothetical protein [Papaver nudicaule]
MPIMGRKPVPEEELSQKSFSLSIKLDTKSKGEKKTNGWSRIRNQTSVTDQVLPDGKAIAVKVISSNSMHRKKEFLNEIDAMSTLRHPNIATFFGHCVAADNKFLLKNIKERLNWETRVKICIGIAKSLVFLHERAGSKIVHRDIKLANVLVDKDLTPKIADFGLAKLLDGGEGTHTG